MEFKADDQCSLVSHGNKKTIQILLFGDNEDLLPNCPAL